MHKITFHWQPVNIGIVFDIPKRYLAIGFVFWTYRYNDQGYRD